MSQQWLCMVSVAQFLKKLGPHIPLAWNQKSWWVSIHSSWDIAWVNKVPYMRSECIELFASTSKTIDRRLEACFLLTLAPQRLSKKTQICRILVPQMTLHRQYMIAALPVNINSQHYSSLMHANMHYRFNTTHSTAFLEQDNSHLTCSSPTNNCCSCTTQKKHLSHWFCKTHTLEDTPTPSFLTTTWHLTVRTHWNINSATINHLHTNCTKKQTNTNHICNKLTPRTT